MTNCVLCKDELKPEEGRLIWRGDDCRVILVNDPDLPGFCRVIWNRHVAKMTDLSHGERDHIMTLVFAIEEAIRHVMHPDKVNIAALGNMVPISIGILFLDSKKTLFIPDQPGLKRPKRHKLLH